MSSGALTHRSISTRSAPRRGRERASGGRAELAGITFGPTDPAGLKMLVRRLPVIAVEDSAALPCVLPAVWYMMALSPTEKSPATSSSTHRQRPTSSSCARVPRELAATREPRPPSAAAQGPERAADERRELALLIRAAYGGMKGDVAMLKERATSPCSAAGARGETSPWLAPVAAPPVLRPGDWLLEGVDYHQKGGEILGRMRAKEMALQSVSDEDLKPWIWRARSSVNRRDAPRRPAPPPWADTAARAADAAALGHASAWRGP